MFLDRTPGGAIGSAISGVVQSIGLMYEQRQYTKVVRYVSDMEIARANSVVEMQKLKVAEKVVDYQYDAYRRKADFDENQQREVLTLYVDRQYQKKIDQATKEFQKSVDKLQKERRKAIRDISDYTEKTLRSIDKHYREMIRYQESVCTSLRNELAEARKQGINGEEIAEQLTIFLIESGPEMSDCKFGVTAGVIRDIVLKPFPTFDYFVNVQNKMSEFDLHSGKK